MNYTRSSSNHPTRIKYDKLDSDYWEKIDCLLNKYKFSSEQILKNYLALIRRRDIPRLIAHYKIFEKIVNLPGSIVELGVYTGCGLFTWANFLETFCPGDRIRKVIGFDDFKGYNNFSDKDKTAKSFINENAHSLQIDHTFVEELLELHTNDNLLRGIERAIIIKGEITNTVPKFVQSSKGLRISLLYLDANLYSPTKIALEKLYPLIVPGGIVAFNGFAQHPWEGESRALDEFFETLNFRVKINRFPFSTIPSGYFIKEK